MRHRPLFFCSALVLSLLVVFNTGVAQLYTASQIFAHNDYVRQQPFFTAYLLGAGYIEADVFLHDGRLMVAHEEHEISSDRTLEELYLEPLLEVVNRFGGRVYDAAEKERVLTLMIDLKSEGTPTLDSIVALLDRYRPLIASPTLRFLISGNVPDPRTWDRYPPYLAFDGRPGIRYTRRQLQRVGMISTSFPRHVQWDGKQSLTSEQKRTMLALLNDAHSKGKPLRFWATPDFPEAWRTLMDMKMDVIVTDKVELLASFLSGHVK